MENTTIAEIAKKLNVSTAMVSRVLRHCSGVDSEMRQRIIAEAEHLVPADWGECAVYSILPDVPRYFWQPLRKGIADALDASNIPFKSNICTRASDDSIVLRYLDEADRLNAQVIILAAYVTPVIHKRLEALTNCHLVILLSEYHEFVNSFFVGSDAYQDGYIIGDYYASHYKNRELLVLTLPGHYIFEKRIEGFHDALRASQPDALDHIVRIKLEKKVFQDLKLLPSKLAPLLMEAAKPCERLCIYAPMGIPQFPLAMIKAKLADRSVCLCHDCYDSQSKYKSSVHIVSCNQDGYEQGQVAAKLALDFVYFGLYPKHKRTYIPSHLSFPFS